MKKLFPSLLIIVFIFLSGCSTTMQITKPYTPRQDSLLEYKIYLNATISQDGLEILRSRIEQQLRAKGRLANKPADAQEKVEINITNYKMRGDTARVMLGIFAGTDNMQSTIIVKDKKLNKIISEFKIESGNSTAWGTSRGMIEDHADKIVNYLTGSN
jgi:uncharacterized protein YcfL